MRAEEYVDVRKTTALASMEWGKTVPILEFVHWQSTY